jgi:hypothetical protein
MLQHHLAGLALQHRQERTERCEHQLHSPEALLQPSSPRQRSISTRQPTGAQRGLPDKPLTTRRVHPAKGCPRPILPLIEYAADGTYIVMCPHQGKLALVPDSPEWFAWLEMVSSLRFPGRQGRWSAYRAIWQASCCWFPIAASTGISMFVHLAVRTNGSSPVSKRWRPRSNPLSRLPGCRAGLQTGAGALCLRVKCTRSALVRLATRQMHSPLSPFRRPGRIAASHPCPWSAL